MRFEPKTTSHLMQVVFCGDFAHIGFGVKSLQKAIKLPEVLNPRTLEKLRIEPQMLQVLELKISWIMPEEQIDDTVKLLYQELIEKGEC